MLYMFYALQPLIVMLVFFLCLGATDWLGYWGKHMRATCFKGVREYQKVNTCDLQNYS